MPPIMRFNIVDNNGEIDVKAAYIPGLDSLAIKISPGFFDNPKLGLDILPCQTIAQATENADNIVTTTPSTKPLLKYNDVKPGQHIPAMGSDSEHKNELEPDIFTSEDMRYFCDRLSQTRELGELHHAIEKGLVSNTDEFPKLVELLLDKTQLGSQSLKSQSAILPVPEFRILPSQPWLTNDASNIKPVLILRVKLCLKTPD